MCVGYSHCAILSNLFCAQKLIIWENSHQIQFLLNKNFISQKLFEKINRQYIYKLYFVKFDITTYFRVHEIGVFDVDTSTVEKLEARNPRLKVFKQQFTLRHLKLLDELSFQKILYHFSHFLILTRVTVVIFIDFEDEFCDVNCISLHLYLPKSRKKLHSWFGVFH